MRIIEITNRICDRHIGEFPLKLEGAPPQWLKLEMIAKLNRIADYLSDQCLIQSTISPDLCVGFAMATLRVQDILDEFQKEVK